MGRVLYETYQIVIELLSCLNHYRGAEAAGVEPQERRETSEDSELKPCSYKVQVFYNHLVFLFSLIFLRVQPGEPS